MSTNLASVHALVCDEGLSVVLEPVWLEFRELCVQCVGELGFVRCGK